VLAWGSYDAPALNTTGWSYLSISANATELNATLASYGAGFLEGFLTSSALVHAGTAAAEKEYAELCGGILTLPQARVDLKRVFGTCGFSPPPHTYISPLLLPRITCRPSIIAVLINSPTFVHPHHSLLVPSDIIFGGSKTQRKIRDKSKGKVELPDDMASALARNPTKMTKADIIQCVAWLKAINTRVEYPRLVTFCK